MEKSVGSIANSRQLMSNNLYQKLVFSILKRIKNVGLTIHDPLIPGDGKCFFGDATAELQATLNIHDQAVYKALATGGRIAAAESYIDNQ